MTESSTAWALMTVDLAASAKTLAAAARELKVPRQAIDRNFGLVPVDEAGGLYAVQVRAEALEAAAETTPYRGPHSNPPIAPFSVSDED